MGDKLGIGVIGLHEGLTLIEGLTSSKRCVAVAGCDLREEKIAAARAQFPDLFYTTHYEEMLQRAEVQIVAIYTPDPLHATHIEQAFRAGKHVICTKPLLNALDEAPRLLQTAKETGCRLQVGQSTRFFEPFLRQRARYEAGELGELECVDAHYIHHMKWYYDKSAWAVTDTDWAFLGLSHPVDLVRWYLGSIEEVHAYGSHSALAKEYGVKGNDLYVVNLRSVDGRLGRVLGHYGVTELFTARCMIECFLMGTKGSSLAKYPALELLRLDPDGAEIREDYHHALTGFYFHHKLRGMHYGEFAQYSDYFAECLLGNKPNSPDLVEGIETVCVMEALKQSAVGGVPVQVEPLMRKAGL